MRAALLVALLCSPAAAELEAPAEWLVIAPVDARGRRPFNPDAVFDRYLLHRGAPAPREGEEVTGERGAPQSWRRLAGKPEGRIAYAYAALVCERDTIAMARLRGGAVLFLNGDAFVGDIYGSGKAAVPVPLHQGTNHLYVRGVRGSFRLELEEVTEGDRIVPFDATLPDLVVGEEARLRAGIVVVNASPEPSPGLVPFGVRKLGVAVRRSAPAEAGAVSMPLGVGQRPGPRFELKVREPSAPRRKTFVSGIDGSVQEYSLLPPTEPGPGAGIVLTLHGAGVDAYGQARAYSPKRDLWIVAPTNRRPFGFDWQDWGRRDAYEVLEDALRHTGADKRRVYVTGHSMGGHGAWHLAANDPDRFLAVAPSAGWCTFDTYGGRPGGTHAALWRGADGASLTMDLVGNLAQVPTFILHGSKDDNVPPSEAYAMQLLLCTAGAWPSAHFQEGAGHWWNGPAAAGTDCVDWPGIFDFFARHRPRPSPSRLEFVSVDPGVDADHHWVHLHQPLRYGEPMRVRARLERGTATIRTTNVRRMRVLLPAPLRIDGTALAGDGWFLRTGAAWVASEPAPDEKSPSRSGPFKRAFDNRFVLVYGEGDTDALARARYDAQVWWYRGNGDAPVLSDAQFLAGDYSGRNVVVYGNAETNRAWKRVFPKRCPVRAVPGSLDLGGRRWRGHDLACLFVYPRADDAAALAAAFVHTGPAGARLGYALLPFVSGVGHPDYVAFSAEVLRKGDDGVLAAGWFTHDWSLPR